MPTPTEFARQKAPGSYYPGVNLSLTVADAVNGNKFRMSGNDLVIVKNGHATDPKTVTITSQGDVYNRNGDISDTLAAGVTRVYGPFKFIGWKDPSGFLLLAGQTTDIQFAAIEL